MVATIKCDYTCLLIDVIHLTSSPYRLITSTFVTKLYAQSNSSTSFPLMNNDKSIIQQKCHQNDSPHRFPIANILYLVENRTFV